MAALMTSFHFVNYNVYVSKIIFKYIIYGIYIFMDIEVLLSTQFEMIFKISLSMALTGIIGYERERQSKPAGLRTHMLLALGSTLLTILSFSAFPNSADQSRIAASIVTGIGFIGAGTVLQMKDRVTGLTTAASVWLTTSISVAVATGFYIIAMFVTILGYLVLCSKPPKKKIQISNLKKETSE